jgi:PHS family inorganic phosphate transporter-like MFS transporter
MMTDNISVARSSFSSDYGAILPTEEENIEYWTSIKLPDDDTKKGDSPPSERTVSLGTDDSEWDYLSGFPFEERKTTDRFFEALGFQTSPFLASSDIRNNKASDMRLAMLSNFSTAYNVVSISLALDIMQEIYPVTPQDKSLCSSSLIAGMIVGQLIGGAIGDIFGRHLAMAVVMGLQVIGALVSAASFDGSVSIYVFLAVWRFILGLGCGGVYPLAAAITAESNTDKQDGSKAVALTFSMQGVGYLAAPIMTSLLIAIFPDNYEIAWRFLLGFGAIPGLVLMVLRLQTRMRLTSTKPTWSLKAGTDSKRLREKVLMASTREVPVSVIDAIMAEDDLVRKLLGTGGCWLLFDILFYGNVLFQPVVLSAAFGEAETVQKAAIDTAMVSALALPGYFVSVMTVGRQSPRLIQAQGFLMMGILYAFIGIFFHQLARQKFLMIVLYSSTFFFSNYGPNTTVSFLNWTRCSQSKQHPLTSFSGQTYILPSMTFSSPCRSTLNGFCAACGKAGALLGTMIFVTAASRYGHNVVMLACSFISVVGLAVTLSCVSETVCQNSTKEGEAAAKRVPMKAILSEPSLIDYYQAA